MLLRLDAGVPLEDALQRVGGDAQAPIADPEVRSVAVSLERRR